MDLTVVTPTFNRAYTLRNCYISLLDQTNRSFVWMIIDDGSTDNTESIVKKWIDDNNIIIHYLKKENGGKASAINLALENIKTKYFVCLDSDDTFSKEAIDIAITRLNTINDNSRYCGLLALRTSPNGTVMGNVQLPQYVEEVTRSQIEGKYRIRSEVIVFYKYNIAKEFRFPLISGEKFISPSYFENIISKDHKFIVSRDKICYCRYLPDGLTKNKLEIIINNPTGYTLVKRLYFELTEDFYTKCKNGIMFIAGSMLSKQKKIIKQSSHKFLVISLYPLGLIAFLFRFKFRNTNKK